MRKARRAITILNACLPVTQISNSTNLSNQSSITMLCAERARTKSNQIRTHWHHNSAICPASLLVSSRCSIVHVNCWLVCWISLVFVVCSACIFDASIVLWCTMQMLHTGVARSFVNMFVRMFRRVRTISANCHSLFDQFMHLHVPASHWSSLIRYIHALQLSMFVFLSRIDPFVCSFARLFLCSFVRLCRPVSRSVPDVF